MKAVVFTLGCKVNDVESGSLIRGLERLGYEVSRMMESGADLYVINTCAVTAEAERKSRQTVGKAVKAGKNAKIIVCGCASEKNPQQFFGKDENVFYVSGTMAKNKILELAEKQFPAEMSGVCVEQGGKEYEEMLAPECLKTRAFVKIQDGCNRFCSYCIIPYLRGRSRSRALGSVAKEVLASTAAETVLTGIDISDYKDGDGHTLADVLIAVKDADTRIRLGSIEVGLITDSFLDAAKQVKNFAPQFHLSLQSGSNAVLKSMNRHYTREEYLAACEKIYRAFPNASVTTDIIAGFPTETEEDFVDSVRIIEEAGFLQVHAFPYSPREGTNAYKKYRELPYAVKKERVEILMKKAQEVKIAYLSRFVGKRLQVVPEYLRDGYWEGYSENYIRVYVKDDGLGEPTGVVALELFRDGVLAKRNKIKIIKEKFMENCVFCKIVAGVIPSPRLYEDEQMIVIRDIEPKAKLHYLCIPKQHFALLSEMDEARAEIVKHVFKTIPALEEKLDLQGGYRIIINQGEDGGQTVPHLHVHLLGGEKLSDF